jgi:hypothetical protein
MSTSGPTRTRARGSTTRCADSSTWSPTPTTRRCTTPPIATRSSLKPTHTSHEAAYRYEAPEPERPRSCDHRSESAHIRRHGTLAWGWLPPRGYIRPNRGRIGCPSGESSSRGTNHLVAAVRGRRACASERGFVSQRYAERIHFFGACGMGTDVVGIGVLGGGPGFFTGSPPPVFVLFGRAGLLACHVGLLRRWARCVATL